MMSRSEGLSALVAVVEHGGFSAAVERLGIAKSAVSRRVTDLEARLDLCLLNRCLRHYRRSSRKRQWWDFCASTRSSSCAVEAGNSIDPLPS
jgi:DNA-binding transcriptional LysR family regulator